MNTEINTETMIATRQYLENLQLQSRNPFQNSTVPDRAAK